MSAHLILDRNGRLRSLLAGTTVAVLILATMTFGTIAAQAVTPTTVTFNYNGTTGADGSAQTWTVPPGVFFATFDVYGAQGGTGQGSSDSFGGLGGRATAGLFLTPGDVVTIFVAGAGSPGVYGGAAGFGGGAPGADVILVDGGGGGGASDIRIGGSSLADRKIIAGGGGGSGSDFFENTSGGAGGGPTGGNGLGASGGTGGDQTGSTGSEILGAGSPGDSTTAAGGGGGGGGYWGGAGGGPGSGGGSGGGGGSGFGPADVIFEPGVRDGHGLVTITYTPASANLTVSIGANPSPVISGQNLTYSITIRNRGPNVAFATVLISLQPSASQFVSAKSTKGNCQKPPVGQTGPMVCTLGGMSPNTTVKVTHVVKVVAPPGTLVSETASVSSQTPDPQPANNSATVSTTVI